VPGRDHFRPFQDHRAGKGASKLPLPQRPRSPDPGRNHTGAQMVMPCCAAYTRTTAGHAHGRSCAGDKNPGAEHPQEEAPGRPSSSDRGHTARRPPLQLPPQPRPGPNPRVVSAEPAVLRLGQRVPRPWHDGGRHRPPRPSRDDLRAAPGRKRSRQRGRSPAEGSARQRQSEPPTSIIPGHRPCWWTPSTGD
jgi:hypothetical protein